MTKKEKKKAFGYIRISTALQVEGGYSLDDQENRIRQHVKANDMAPWIFIAARALRR